MGKNTYKKVVELKKRLNNLIFKPKPVVFDHLPKCGGTSINNYLQSAFPKKYTFAMNGVSVQKSVEEFKKFSQKKRYKIKLIYGHLANELFDLAHPDAVLATVLREPVDRIISHYYYVKRRQSHYLYKKVKEQNIQLDEYCYHNLSPELENWYVTHFTGLSISEVQKNPTKSVDIAFKNITEKYHVIGFLNDIPLFINELKRYANIKTQFKNKIVNKTNGRIGIEEVDKFTIEKIAKKNLLDIELFKRLYETKIGIK